MDCAKSGSTSGSNDHYDVVLLLDPAVSFIMAAAEGDLATLTRLLEEGVDVNARHYVSAAPPAAPTPLHPSPSALAARRRCCPALTAAAHRM